MQSRRSPRLAFTLIELLVVIGIISVLIAVLLPALRQARMSADSVRCLSNLRQIGSAMQLYRAAYRDYFAPASNRGFWDDTVTGTPLPLYASNGRLFDGTYWGAWYLPFIGSKASAQYVRISTSDPIPPGRAEPAVGALRNLWRCPASHEFPDPGYSDQRNQPAAYGLNMEIPGGRRWDMTGRYTRKATEFRRPSETIVAHDAPEQLLDGNGDWLTDWEWNGSIWFRRGINIHQWRSTTFSWYMGIGTFEYYRHNRYCNVLWLDGHASGIRLSTGRDVPLAWYLGR